MTRLEHLAFCSVCENRTFDNSKGIICSLTKDVAHFDKNCPEFILDNDRKLQLEGESKTTLLLANGKESSKKYSTSDLLKEYAHLKLKSKYKKSKGLFWFLLALGLFCFGGIIYGLSSEQKNELIENPFTYVIILVIVFLIANSIKSLLKHKPELIFGEESFKFHDKEFNWNQIIAGQIVEVSQENMPIYYLQFCIYPTAKLIEFNISDLGGTPAQLGATFEYFRRQNLNKRV